MKTKPLAEERFRATNLEAILETQGRRREWLAAVAGISPALVTLLLAGKRTVSSDVANQISRALGVPLFLAFDLHERPNNGLERTKGEVAA